MSLQFNSKGYTSSFSKRRKKTQSRLSVTAPFLSNYAHQSHVAFQKHGPRTFFFFFPLCVSQKGALMKCFSMVSVTGPSSAAATARARTPQQKCVALMRAVTATSQPCQIMKLYCYFLEKEHCYAQWDCFCFSWSLGQFFFLTSNVDRRWQVTSRFNSPWHF